ncbi:hypothetical protein INR49_017023 [Caranx melampygus]|nr:hypothetical protein INR49_017023 [Caranx melampygus]
MGLRGGALPQKPAAVSCNVTEQREPERRSNGAQHQGVNELQLQEEAPGGPSTGRCQLKSLNPVKQCLWMDSAGTNGITGACGCKRLCH